MNLYLNIRTCFLQLSFKGNCRKLTSERKTKEKDDEDEEKDTNDENDNEENDEEDFAVLDYNGKKGKKLIKNKSWIYRLPFLILTN